MDKEASVAVRQKCEENFDTWSFMQENEKFQLWETTIYLRPSKIEINLQKKASKSVFAVSSSG